MQEIATTCSSPKQHEACKTACAPTANGCLRCEQVPGRAPGIGAVLLAAQDADASAVLEAVLATANFRATQLGALLVVTGSLRQLSEVAVVLRKQVSAYTQSCIRATYAPRGVHTDRDAVNALIFAEPLSKMLATWEHEWVRDALEEGWLYSVFHPIVDARTGKVVGQEALMRAREPVSGTNYGAGQIIGACEALNLQHQLDQRARRCAIYNASKFIARDEKLFINFMPNTIYDPEICLRTTMEAARKFRVDLSRIVFEVVETEQIPDMDRLLNILNYYRERGVATAVDDMGAGFSSVKYIEELHPDFVKLDRDLVVRAETDPAARARVCELVTASHDAGAQVIAEGIETASQMQLSIDCGADLLQGFLFAKPACPPAEINWPEHARRVA
ncbi:MAG TPA: EAL domain-containing protein [Tepidisphaeraceae bacterium]|jgi:EAL domain-containing protein (putative c-di-GMP-specific phosphodiesterase class I)|nr:EAL domain-containing protein [Tepidisphaeraceae bacterium]